ncbi:hypothetical protein A3A20_01035 [Candidatus Wolfebacteria bacterium RIFCSPLOWO2_01_FULL_45_19]|uniref:Uncharacterized protein n=1 Tax=Candidatus Wolfebacteria bacterium RIFCSPLOWO2_01_FULL_45_19 TaxID=1802557 RepID=A0A1F8DQV5_9BACT|nr:MAG: hypothetical protein UX23_C0003G0032 [Parcubacteria group bacterium GW2011_GWB1_45_9]OGM90822.1 MAG: hypothetical protein A3A20_01035 [Candidatus Wolfebacteria bacterium RIFCSPLOWO2_01_FULL_45_19]
MKKKRKHEKRKHVKLKNVRQKPQQPEVKKPEENQKMSEVVCQKRQCEEVRAGFFSRIDYCGHGYRRRLMERGFKLAEAEQTHFNVLVGGLVHNAGLKERIEEEIAKEKGKPKDERASREEVKNRVLGEVAAELAEQIPVVKATGTEKKIRLYVMTSLAYDGAYGAEIAEKLALLRPDVRHWAKWSEHLPLKPPPNEKFKEIACLVPTKQTFRSKYDSTAVDRAVEDYLNLANKPYAPVVVVGCYDVSFYKPAGGESSLHIIALPGLSRTEENRASENQIGITVLRLTKDGNLFVRCHNLNYLVVHERESINISPKYSASAQQILEQFKYHSWRTVGLLNENLRVTRDELKKNLDKIVKQTRLHPPLRYDSSSHRYYISRQWIQQNLTYPYPWPNQSFIDERFISFGCLHALCCHTAHEFMLNDLHQFMLEYKVRHLVGAGDFIEGSKHGHKELIFGADYVAQERFAAWLTATPMLKAFKTRFVETLSGADQKLFTNETAVLDFVKAAYSDFWYIPGNHDEWTEAVSVAALTTFRYELLMLLRTGITNILRNAGCVIPMLLEEFIENNTVKMVPLDAAMHPAGVTVSLNHLHMARAQTKTLRSQALLGATSADVNIHANFHTALAMARFDPEMGQRVIQQIGTLKLRSGFEDRKGKRVDFGVGYLRLGLQQRGDKKSILMHEFAFFGDPSKYSSLDNEAFIEDFKKGMEEIVAKKETKKLEKK